MCIQGGLPGFFGSQQMWFVTVAYANHGPLGGRCCWPRFSSTMSLLHSDSSHLSLKFQLLYLYSCEEGRARTQSLLSFLSKKVHGTKSLKQIILMSWGDATHGSLVARGAASSTLPFQPPERASREQGWGTFRCQPAELATAVRRHTHLLTCICFLLLL